MSDSEELMPVKCSCQWCDSRVLGLVKCDDGEHHCTECGGIAVFSWHLGVDMWSCEDCLAGGRW